MTDNLPALSHPDGSPIRALVVDDEPSLSELMSMGLRMAGWPVAVAADGPQAVKLAKEFRPDVLVLDVMLPGFDGVELLGRIRAFAPEVPALFLTAKDAVQDRIVGLAAGGDDYVTKPFSMEEVLLRLHRLVQRSGVAAMDTAELVVGDLVLNVDTREVSRVGTMNARILNGEVNSGGFLTSDTSRSALSAEDKQTLLALATDAEPVDRTLSNGGYRLVAVKTTFGDVLVTGLPLAAKESTLASLVLTFVVVSLGGLLLIGLVGTVLIRRTMKPLEQLSEVATRVSQLPLDAGEVALAVRVPPS
jgi:CheY-like chemotaxis protein